MPLVESLPVNECTAQWPQWSTVARLVVTEPGLLETARALMEAELADIDIACSRFRPDSEIHRVASGAPVPISPELERLVAAALRAAVRTDGDVDPTLGNVLSDLGYDRDIHALSGDRPAGDIRVSRRAHWRQIVLKDRTLTVPSGVLLDLGATAKAVAADRCAHQIASILEIGVLVALGGDIATAGPAADWQILVQDGAGEPAAQISVPSGTAVATSSTQSRRWRSGGKLRHHIIDPRTCLPAPAVWRTVSIVAPSCLETNSLTTAALVRGHSALPWLRDQGLPTRLVTATGEVVTLNGWPAGEFR
jgi:thiamine biosynthesis lipoprotein